MIGLRERFTNWRKDQALHEENFIKSALLFAAYTQTIVNVQQVTRDFNNHESEVYQSFDVYGGRSVGVLLYSKLFIEQLLETNHQMNTIERQLLSKLNDTLAGCYESPTTNTKQKVEDLISTTKHLLSLDLENVSNIQQAKTLCYILYIFLSTVILSVSKLSRAALFLINRFVDLDKLMRDVHDLRTEAEERVGQMDEIILQERVKLATSSQHSNQSIQEHFNLRYLLLSSQKKDEEDQLSVLDTGMKDVIEGLSRLIYLREEQIRIKNLIPSVQSLLRSYEANEGKVTGRKYIWELVEQNKSAFEQLMSVSSGQLKSKLENNLRQLQSPDLIQYIALAIGASISWLTSPFRAVYRYVTPKSIQERIPMLIQTLDSESKYLLKEMASRSVNQLSNRLASVRAELLKLPAQLALNNPQLMQLIQEDTSEHLSQLVKVNTEIRSTLCSYINLITKIKHDHAVLKQYQQTNAILANFITKNDGFWVQVSNFFARFCSIFKTKTAEMIETARVLQLQIGQFENEYHQEVEQTIVQVESMLTLEPGLKAQLITQLRHIESKSNDFEAIDDLNRAQLLELMDETATQLRSRYSNRLFFKKPADGEESEPMKLIFQPFG
ncbi:hypothetical protein [Legionella waltersii]|uniref:Purine NTPase n=1 Tax=Legionella waltersii TaxID=66969 RepID=A0A0W1A0T0_9GAMM|nr:hypothetical protein [Legionella waltersii]KTD74659.1 purine NTPase [Legionella waltersii]SNV09082.1 purine NTPase, putative [Legionella waltersii]